MQVILFETVQNLGSIGDTVNVKPGFARNYLIPQGKAVPATPEALAAVEARRVELVTQEDEARVAAQAKAEQLDGMSVTIAGKAGEEGKLFRLGWYGRYRRGSRRIRGGGDPSRGAVAGWGTASGG